MSDDFPIKDYGKVTKKIMVFISDQVKSRKKKGVVIGLSGGIDSSVCVVLASRALGNRRTIGLLMPEKGLTPKMDIQNARNLAKRLKIRYKEIQIERGKKILLKTLPKDRLVEEIFQRDSEWHCYIILQQPIICWYWEQLTKVN